MTGLLDRVLLRATVTGVDQATPHLRRIRLSGESLYHLFFGDEAASVAFGAMLRAQPGGVPVHGVIGLEDPADRLPLPRGDELNWVARGNLLTALRDLALPDGPGAAYLAGEARTCQLARRHLVDERGWPCRAVLVKPFWAPGRRGLE